MSSTSRTRNAQAMIELIVGLVAIMTVTVGLLQLVSLMLAYNRVQVEARRDAGQDAFLETAPISTASFLEDWEAGNDGARYSADDKPIDSSSESSFAKTIVEHASDTTDGWTEIGKSPSDRLQALRAGAGTANLLGLVSSKSKETVSLMSAVQSLLFDASSIEVKSEVFMAWCDGIY